MSEKEDFLNEFLDLPDEPIKGIENPEPQWVNTNQTSRKAYESINVLFEVRKTFIKRHSKASEFKAKKDWTITQKEVADDIEQKSPQSLFNARKYSRDLKRHLDSINASLAALKDRRLDSFNDGLRKRNKSMLIDQVRELQKKENDITKEAIEGAYSRALDKLGIDIKRRLGLS